MSGHPARGNEEAGKLLDRRQARRSESALWRTRCLSYVYRLNFVVKGETLGFSTLMLLITSTDITVWIVSALLAIGIGLSKYAKWKTRNQLVRELAAMDRERREKLLSRMNPAQAMEARQELMRRFNIF